MKKYTFLIIPFVPLFIVFLILSITKGDNFAIWNPQGIIAFQERNLIFFSISLMMLLAIPAIFLTFFTAWKYRDSNTKTRYEPTPKNSLIFQLSLWGILTVAACILSVVTWNATHQLDPYKSLPSTVKPITIQVVALRWKWLFIYPDLNLATVNFMQIPVHTPIHFTLTADNAPMNSFWIPQLSGQIYAMTGMATQLHILADTPGTFTGSAAEISGQGFADMRFPVKVTSMADFTAWVTSVKNSHHPLDPQTYMKLIQPTEENPQAFYAPVPKDLYNEIIMKYMAPSPTGAMQGM